MAESRSWSDFAPFNPGEADYSRTAHAYGHSVPGHDDGVTWNDSTDSTASAGVAGEGDRDISSAGMQDEESRLLTFHAARDAGGLGQAN